MAPNDPTPENASPLDAKKDMRTRLRALREALSEDERAELSALVLENLRRTPAWEEAREVLSYMPVRGEVDVRPLLAVVREEMGVPLDPIAAYWASAYEDKIRKERGLAETSGGYQ